jgi:hypothetical protein
MKFHKVFLNFVVALFFNRQERQGRQVSFILGVLGALGGLKIIFMGPHPRSSPLRERKKTKESSPLRERGKGG